MTAAPGADPFASMERLLRGAPLLRTVNFHHTPAADADALDRLLARLARHFSPVTEDRLEHYGRTGAWQGPPGIVPAFYNGYRSHFAVARPLLERHGFVGWFFVVSGFTAEPAATQRDFAARNRLSAVGEADGPRVALSWDEVRALDAAGHVVASHTRSHADVEAGDAAALRDEIVGAQEDFRRALGRPVRAFAANRGAPFGVNPAADRLIREAGHRFVFSNLRIQRIAEAP